MAKVCVLLIASVVATFGWTQGYVSDPPSKTGPFQPSIYPGRLGPFNPIKFPGGDKPFNPVVSKRDEVELPAPVGDLLDKIEDIVAGYRKGNTKVTVQNLEEAFEEIAAEARDIIDNSTVKVTDKDVVSFVGDVAGSFFHILAKSPLDETPLLDFAVDVLTDILEKVQEDPAKVYIAVAAIEETADTISNILSRIRGAFELFGIPLRKRWTVGGNINHGPAGTSYGVSLSHSWRRNLDNKRKRWTVGGNIDHGPGGTSYGVSVSHSWRKRLDKLRKRWTVDGHVNHGPAGTSYGASLSHSWRKRLQKRQTTIGGKFNNGPNGPSVSGSLSHTWKHKGGGQTTFGGNVGYGGGGASGGLSFSHTWGRKRAHA